MPPATRRNCRAAAELLKRGAQPRSPAADLTVRVTAQGNGLRYRYEGANPSVGAGCEGGGALVLPAARRVRPLVTSDDAVYSWRVLALGVSADLISGRVNEVRLDHARTRPPSAPDTLRNERSGRETATEVRLLHDGASPLDLRALCGG